MSRVMHLVRPFVSVLRVSVCESMFVTSFSLPLHLLSAVPLISCEIVKYSLKHGICQKATIAFASYGMFKIFLEGNYDAGKLLGDIVRAITQKNADKATGSGQEFDIRAHVLLVSSFGILSIVHR